MFDLLGVRPRPRAVRGDNTHAVPSQRGTTAPRPLSSRPPGTLPPSVAKVAARTRLSAELLAAILTVDGRTRATLDDMERADALADVLLTRRRERESRHRPEPAERADDSLRWSA